MISFKRFIEEGINDPAIFKAVFLAGGPGSGKSFVVGQTALQALGFKLINSDDAFEAALARAGLQPDPETIFSPQGQELRSKAKALTGKKMDRAIEGRLGLVIDGTGKDYDKIKKQVDMLRELGYSVMMLFVNTDIETALSRNQKRSRSLPDDTVKKMWSDVQKNIGRFQNFFRDRLIVVDNSDGSDSKKILTSVYKRVSAWSKTPADNHVAKKWISQQKKERGIKEDAELNARQADEKQRLLARQRREKEIMQRRHDTQDANAQRKRERERLGRSAVKEKNLKWYTNGIDNVYVTEGTEPEGYRRGRTTKWQGKNAKV